MGPVSTVILDRGKIEAVVRGSAQDPSLLCRTDRATRRVLAYQLRQRADRPTLCDPQHLCYRDGIRILPRWGPACGPEVNDPDVVRWQWTNDAAENGLRVFHKLAHALLIRADLAHTEADAWLLTGELTATPELLTMLSLQDVVQRMVFAPAWFLGAIHTANPTRARGNARPYPNG
jgi:hypothetical protein